MSWWCRRLRHEDRLVGDRVGQLLPASAVVGHVAQVAPAVDEVGSRGRPRLVVLVVPLPPLDRTKGIYTRRSGSTKAGHCTSGSLRPTGGGMGVKELLQGTCQWQFLFFLITCITATVADPFAYIGAGGRPLFLWAVCVPVRMICGVSCSNQSTRDAWLSRPRVSLPGG
jgi:hypothetical protein